MKSARVVVSSRIMVRRAISWGVWGRMWTLGSGTERETVAVGFSDAGRYEGPTPRAGLGQPPSLFWIDMVICSDM